MYDLYNTNEYFFALGEWEVRGEYVCKGSDAVS